jgi:tetratricopeptide (TPR) repeat protein
MAMTPNRAVTREYLAAVSIPTEFGAALRTARNAISLSIRGLEKKANDTTIGGPYRHVELTKNLIEDMEKGRRIERTKADGHQDNRLEIYLWCCGVPKDDLSAWLETRHRVLHEPPVTAALPDRVAKAAVAAAARPTVTTALRRDVHTLLGRDSELHRILGAAGPQRVVSIYTIGGMPGVGKTALATRAAHMLADRFPDGRYFVELHAHTPGQTAADPADVLARLLTDLGIDPRNIPDTLDGRRDLWQDRLTGKQVLLVLDDARDHAQIEPLIPTEPRCATLVTSRQRLMALEDALPLPLDVLEPGPAAELFTVLANRTPATDVELRAVGRIVAMCGFLPLAIVLLAGRLAHHPRWSITDMADEFAATTDRLDELDTGGRAVHAAFGMSYRSLPPQRQALFRRLGLHPGPELDAYAAAALADIAPAAAKRELEALYTDHLVDETTLGRYRLHDLLRDYTRALAAADPPADNERAVRALLDYYQHTAAVADGHLARLPRSTAPPDGHPHGSTREFGGEVVALAWMRAERANLLACLNHAAVGEPARLVGLTAILASLLERDGPWPQAALLHARALAAAEHLDDRLAEANAFDDFGRVRWLTGDYGAAAVLHRHAFDCYRGLGNSLGEANALNNLGNVRQETGDYLEAAELYGQALDLYRGLGHPLGEANALDNLGNVCEETGDFLKAAELHEHALALYCDLGNRRGEANARNNLGIVRVWTGDYAEAAELYRQALALYHELGNPLGEANALNNLGILRTRTGDYAEAAGLHRQALALYHELGHRRGEASALGNLGLVRTRTGDYAEAAELHRQALALYHELGHRRGEANTLTNLGNIRKNTRDFAEAAALLRQALVRFRELRYRRGEAEVLIDIGLLSAEAGESAAAMAIFTEALELAREIGSQPEQARALEGRARCRASLGDDEAADELREAVEIYRRVGALRQADAVAAYLAELERGGQPR